MADLTLLPHQLDDKNCVCRAIIETPKGCRNKFDYDPDSGLFMLGGLLPEGMMFPFDFGFIPSTLGEDGDPPRLPVPDSPAGPPRLPNQRPPIWFHQSDADTLSNPPTSPPSPH